MKNIVLIVVSCFVAVYVFAQRAPSRLTPPMDSPRPIAASDSIVMEDMTWMEVRDAIKAGKTTAILATGAFQNAGPYVVNGKHDYIVRKDAEAIARKLGNALVAPIMTMAPTETTIELEPTLYPGSFFLRREVYKQVLIDECSSLRRHGIKNIVLFTDISSTRSVVIETTKLLNEKWAGEPISTAVHYIPEYLAQHDVIDDEALPQLGIVEKDEGIHDSYRIDALMVSMNPEFARLDQRIAAGKATINGVSLVPKEKTIEIGNKLTELKVNNTVEAIRKVIGVEKAR